MCAAVAAVRRNRAVVVLSARARPLYYIVMCVDFKFHVNNQLISQVNEFSNNNMVLCFFTVREQCLQWLDKSWSLYYSKLMFYVDIIAFKSVKLIICEKHTCFL